jgi:plasmid stabilization system protein ParE
MVYKYRWLAAALEDLSQEVGYVLCEFGIQAARKAEFSVRQAVECLCLFPNTGVRYGGLMYEGYEVRVLRQRQVSIIYCLQGDMITLIAVWNNHRDDKRIEAMIQSRQDID